EITREWRGEEGPGTGGPHPPLPPPLARDPPAPPPRGGGGGRGGGAGGRPTGGRAAPPAPAPAGARPPRRGGGRGAARGGGGGAASVGERIGEPNVIYLDIGGTTAKCSLIEDGQPKTTTEYKLEWRPDYAGYPAMVSVVDVVEIGAGGGSIAWVDPGGSIRVG